MVCILEVALVEDLKGHKLTLRVTAKLKIAMSLGWISPWIVLYTIVSWDYFWPTRKLLMARTKKGLVSIHPVPGGPPKKTRLIDSVFSKKIEILYLCLNIFSSFGGWHYCTEQFIAFTIPFLKNRIAVLSNIHLEIRRSGDLYPLKPTQEDDIWIGDFKGLALKSQRLTLPPFKERPVL